MYYAKQIDENGEIIALHTMDRPFPESAEFIPITEVELRLGRRYSVIPL